MAIDQAGSLSIRLFEFSFSTINSMNIGSPRNNFRGVLSLDMAFENYNDGDAFFVRSALPDST